MGDLSIVCRLHAVGLDGSFERVEERGDGYFHVAFRTGGRAPEVIPPDVQGDASRPGGQCCRATVAREATQEVNEGFLRQSAFSEVDRYCSPQRQTAMLKLILRFVTLAETALDNAVPPQRIAELDVLRRLQRMGEEIGESDLAKFADLGESVEVAMAGLRKAVPAHAS